jgi:hypothetical protein
LLLLVLPWSSFWETNYFAYAWPPLADILSNHYVRGGVSGLGLVNLIAGFAELAPVFALRDTSSGTAAPDDIDRPSPEPPDSTRGEARS